MIVQNAPVDVLSDVLRLMEAQALCSVSLIAAGDWSIRFPAPKAIKFNAVLAGSCWIQADGPGGTGSPQRLHTGDCFVVVRGGFVLSSAPGLPAVAAEAVFRAPDRDARIGVADGAGGGGCEDAGEQVRLLGGSVRFDQPDGGLLLDLLPPAMAIRSTAPAAAPVGWLLQQLDREWRGGMVGAQTACNDLLRLIFVHALRTHLAEQPPIGANWLAASADPSIGRALGAIHADPNRDWTLGDLARVAGRSRSSFAAAFRERVGVPPIDYLLRWRMRLAAARLRRGREPVSAIAASLGYLSDSAFSATFRRIMGASPSRYRAESDREVAPQALQRSRTVKDPSSVAEERERRRTLDRR